MCSAGGLCIMVLVCLAAAVPTAALAEVHGAAAGIGLLNIPSKASLTNCSSSCGDTKFSYPFGIGPGCFRQGFELTCDQTARPPSLFLGNNSSTTQITSFYDDYSYYGTNYVVSAIGFNITKIPGVDTYNRTWEAPAKGIVLDGTRNNLYVVGCDVDVYMFNQDSTDLIGACTSTCGDDNGIMENSTVESSCVGNNGCCLVWLPIDLKLQAFWLELVHHEGATAKPHPDVKVIVSNNYDYYTSDLYSSWVNSSNMEGAWLEIPITDQPSCESGMNKSSYACNDDSNCMDVPYGRGYSCLCPNYRQGNPYVINGCTQAYDSRLHENCVRSCGDMAVPFPFGIEKDCFADDDFRLNCTPNNVLVLDRGYAQYRVKNLSLDDGLLVVSNMLNDSSSNNIERLIDSNYLGTNNEYVESVVDGIFDFSQQGEIRVKWVVANLTCQEAMKINATYACVSQNSGCQDVQRETTRDGYRCKCSDGYHGNPYLPNGCTG